MSPAPCPDDETLTAYVLDQLQPAWRATVESHLDSCPACVMSTAAARSRLVLDGEIDRPVSAALREAAAPPASLAMQLRDWWRVLRASLLRPPVLVPVGVAALALVMLVGRGAEPPASEWGVRGGTAAPATLQVAVPHALVYAEPSTARAVVAELSHGAWVTALGQRGPWARVRLEDGTVGWMLHEDFE